jgi:zinc protease
MDWGTTSYDRKAYEAEKDAIAANVDLGSTFGATVTSEHFDRAIQLLADGMLHPAFPPAGFAVSKIKRLQVLSAAEQLPAAQAAVAQDDALYAPGDPRRRRATAQSTAAISLADVRRWYALAFRPDLTTISIVGDVSPDRARSIVERYFGNWKAFGNRPSFNRASLPQRASAQQTITVKSPSLAQSQVTLKEVLPMRLHDPDYAALLLANTILSGEERARCSSRSCAFATATSTASIRSSTSTRPVRPSPSRTRAIPKTLILRKRLLSRFYAVCKACRSTT